MKKTLVLGIIMLLSLTLVPVVSSAHKEGKKETRLETKALKFELKEEGRKFSARFLFDERHDLDEDDDLDEDEDEDEGNGKRAFFARKIDICHKNSHTLNVSTNALFGHLVHGDDIGHCDEDDTATTTPPVIDIQPPLISSVSVVVGVNNSQISWITDEPATSLVSYSTSADSTSTTTSSTEVSETTLVTNHILDLNGLNASTTYYFVIYSGDDSGNIASSTSSAYTFSTDALSQSNVTATSTASTTARVMWDTNVETDATLWYATSTPVISAYIPLSISTSTQSLSHLIELDGLAASTQYYYFVLSADLFGNNATSTDYSFMTLSL